VHRIPWTKLFCEALIVAQIFKHLRTYYWKRNSRAHCYTLSWSRWNSPYHHNLFVEDMLKRFLPIFVLDSVFTFVLCEVWGSDSGDWKILSAVLFYANICENLLNTVMKMFLLLISSLFEDEGCCDFLLLFFRVCVQLLHIKNSSFYTIFMNTGIKIMTFTCINVVTKWKCMASKINLILRQVSVLDECTCWNYTWPSPRSIVPTWSLPLTVLPEYLPEYSWSPSLIYCTLNKPQFVVKLFILCILINIHL
jgi:hypothetical protein